MNSEHKSAPPQSRDLFAEEPVAARTEAIKALAIASAQAPSTLARSTDPDTSQTAARMAHQVGKAHREMVIAALAKFGPMTCDEIAAKCGLTGHHVNKRTSELERAGIAAPNGETRLSKAKRPSRVWALKPEYENKFMGCK
jgi:predicted Rossmann fold nucleotide-binding protein DprA/Smf involved in DNA uptake